MTLSPAVRKLLEDALGALQEGALRSALERLGQALQELDARGLESCGETILEGRRSQRSPATKKGA